MSTYELGVLGGASAAERETLSQTIGDLISEFGLTLGSDVVIHHADTIASRDRRAAFAAVYFGTNAPATAEVEAARELTRSTVPVIPTIAQSENFGASIPDFLQAANGLRRRDDDPKLMELAVALLECVGLLRRQRRIFVSYRRVESRAAALQLHDLMSARGFDVFLDTHDIRPGDPFQDVLWHRLCDSDLMVMLDTPTYFESKWTRQEIGRARAKDIHVLRVVWPEHVPSKLTDMAETVHLAKEDLEGTDGPIVSKKAEAIVLAVERLRSRSIASRYLAITGKLRADVEKIGGTIEGIGTHRSIAVRLMDDQKLLAYPMVGIPTAEALNEVAEKATRASRGQKPILVYDHVGIRDAWAAHLKWLDENIQSVRAIKVSEAGWTLAGFEG